MSPIRWICLAVFGLLVTVGVFALGVFVWVDKCNFPSDDALRVLVLVVKGIETRELAASGHVGDIDARLRSAPPPHIIGLDHYRVVTRKAASGYEIVIQPTGWCFCRATYILRDGGKQLQVIRPFLNRRN
jgi:hypothetical protein